MSLLQNILGKFLGTKSDKDLKLLKPIIDKVNKKSAGIEVLSNDQLRAKTIEFQLKLKENVSSERNR